jgi:hypothetical protein
MKLSEIREKLMKVEGRFVSIDISICNAESIPLEIKTWSSDTKSSTKHSSIADALAFLERRPADDDIEDDEPTTESLEAMGFGVAGGDK